MGKSAKNQLRGIFDQPRETPQPAPKEKTRAPEEPPVATTGPRGGSVYQNTRTGTVLARMTLYMEPELQRALKQAALDRNVSANALVLDALRKELGTQ